MRNDPLAFLHDHAIPAQRWIFISSEFFLVLTFEAHIPSVGHFAGRSKMIVRLALLAFRISWRILVSFVYAQQLKASFIHFISD